jgi:SnoaL-like domain
VDFELLRGDPGATHSADDFTNDVQTRMAGAVATQHIIPHHLITIEGDHAWASVGMYAWDGPSADGGHPFTLRGSYRVALQHTGATWLIAGLTMTASYDKTGSPWQSVHPPSGADTRRRVARTERETRFDDDW